MQKLMLLVGLIFLSAQTFSQRMLQGIVYSENQEPLAGASVVMNPGNHGTVTDRDGHFQFSGITSPTVQIRVSFMGYETWQAMVDPGKTKHLKITLKAASHLTEEVVVRAYRAGHQTPVAHTDLAGEALRGAGVGNDIPSLLKLTPSLVSTSESGIGLGSTNLRIRGTDPTRINVTMNGVPLNDSESQAVFWANMPDFANSVENVQIQRGVGTSTQGSAAFGASINFQTTTSDPRAYAEITSTAGSFNTFKNSIRFGTGLINEKFSFEGRYSRLKSDGYIKNAFSDHQSLYLGGTMHFDNSFLKMIILHGDQQTGISWWGVPQEMLETDRRYNPAGVYTDELGNEQYYDDQTDNYKQTHAQLFYSWAAGQQLHLTAALHYTRGEGFYEQYKEKDSLNHYGISPIQISAQTIETSDLIRRKWMENDFYGATLSGDLKLSSQSSLTFGGGWNRYDGDHFGRIIWMRYAGITEKDYEWYFNNGTKTEHNLFTKFDWEASPLLRLFLDMQYRGINYDMSGMDDDLRSLDQEHDFQFFNPKVGFYLTPGSNHNIYAFAGISNREPTRTNFKDANLDREATPKAERLYDIETGYKYESAAFSGGINLYYMYYEDQLIPTGEKSNVGNPILTNVDESYRAGVEVIAAVHPVSWLHWDMNLTLSRNIIYDFVETSTNSYPTIVNGEEEWITETVIKPLGDTQIAYSPSVVGSSNLTVDLTSGLSVGLLSKYVGEQYFDNTESEDRKLDAWLVNDIQFNWTLNPKPFKSIGLQFTIHNVLDHEYESNAYGGNWYEEGVENTWAYYYPMAGRYYMGQVVIRF
ncbi:TonB-dependent receptor [Thermophagus sp. OGC60D27]|uniref:TonB-dependent receptor n=1 Tax=Thermophagus sp. OGC60D27 TaxID=3458415 RepID=UPI00403804E1